MASRSIRQAFSSLATGMGPAIPDSAHHFFKTDLHWDELAPDEALRANEDRQSLPLLERSISSSWTSFAS